MARARLVAFCAVGTIGFMVNVAVYALAVDGWGLLPSEAAVVAFVAAVVHNYLLGRWWTFRDARAGVAAQGARFAVVSIVVLGLNLGLLQAFVPEFYGVLAQVLAIGVTTPACFLANRYWAFSVRAV